MKIAIIGAGNVGSTLAERVLAHDLADVILVDIASDLAKARAFDIMDASPVLGHEKKVRGTGDYKEIKNAGAVVITAGFPRRPGMSRDDLIRKNSEIVRGVIGKVKTFAPNAIIIMVTNPLDVMTYLAYKELRPARRRILGMAGNLDTARFKTLLSEEIGVLPEEIETFVLGSHGDTMVPLISKTLVKGKPLEESLSRKKIAGLVERTKKRGGEIVGLLKTGSAHFSPSAACFEILKAIVKDEKKIIPCSCILEGEYGISACSVGVPAVIGKGGVEEIMEWQLPEEDLEALKSSAASIKENLAKL